MTSSADWDDPSPSDPSRIHPPLRASDTERAETVRVLQDAVARGLLGTDEADQRMAAAFAAVHRRDLRPLTADLPPAPSSPSPPGWGALAALTVAQLRSSLGGDGGERLRAGRVAVVLLLTFLAVVVGSAFVDALD
ncbi:DUF1707 domain-containing protein [Geodermatophilus sp. YIM 151500]|uniref:DUF1707 SHOCT-like domain-containing protein n=1 Tax=Geodermatophilus sp. YIM 151500 TaxID=2984531 RepID=UPI0021E4B098|nr:DUF1707 domain-containing protein [Geodermatophilus sp. YIM 151500]MCV2489883.1 DUF1707 domain-containing protein [Geodermatophilus sp. YIM 151500]